MKRIHITIGDPGGIGVETLILGINKLLNTDSEFFSKFITLIYTPFSVIERYKDKISFDYNIIEDIDKAQSGINIFNIKELNKIDYQIGTIDKNNGYIAAKSIEEALKYIKPKEVLITLPINKESINLAGYKFNGHTEFLAFLTNTEEVFMSFWGKINTLLLTTHISMEDMIKKIRDKDYVYTKIKNSSKLIEEVYGRKIKFGLCGLNPHAGENGLMGKEEVEVLSPVVERLRKDGIDISYPQPSDTIFYRYLNGEFDFIYSLYHDQALSVIKTFFLNKSVNFTLGLPFYRISPDHGTAFDIAGMFIANYEPFIYTLKFGIKLYERNFRI